MRLPARVLRHFGGTPTLEAIRAERARLHRISRRRAFKPEEVSLDRALSVAETALDVRARRGNPSGGAPHSVATLYGVLSLQERGNELRLELDHSPVLSLTGKTRAVCLPDAGCYTDRELVAGEAPPAAYYREAMGRELARVGRDNGLEVPGALLTLPKITAEQRRDVRETFIEVQRARLADPADDRLVAWAYYLDEMVAPRRGSVKDVGGLQARLSNPGLVAIGNAVAAVARLFAGRLENPAQPPAPCPVVPVGELTAGERVTAGRDMLGTVEAPGRIRLDDGELLELPSAALVLRHDRYALYQPADQPDSRV